MLNCWLLAWTVVVVTASTSGNTSPYNDNMKNELTRNRKTLAMLKSIIQDLDNNLVGVNKRGCDINLPGFDCENGKMVHSGDDANWWGRGMTPGKKRMGGCINADGSSCDNAQIAQEIYNRRPWINGPGRRKRTTP